MYSFCLGGSNLAHDARHGCHFLLDCRSVRDTQREVVPIWGAGDKNGRFRP